MSITSIARRVSYLQVRAGSVPARAVPVTPVELEGPADVLAMLAEQVNAVRADPLAEPGEKARTLGLLASIALRAMEAKDLAQRLEAVERVLKLRKDNERDLQKARKAGGRR